MNFFQFKMLIIYLILFGYLHSQNSSDIYLPIATKDRQSWKTIKRTKIGAFGLIRKARPGIPAHLHSAVDMKRPSQNYLNEKIYAIKSGIVISMRDDGAFAQIIIEHKQKSRPTFWSVYEHI